MSNYPKTIQRLIKLANQFADRCDEIDTQSIKNALTNFPDSPCGMEEIAQELLTELQALSPGQLYLIAATLIVAQGNGDFTKVLNAYDALRDFLPQPVNAAFYVLAHGSALAMLLEFALPHFNALGIDVHDLFSPMPTNHDQQAG